MVKLVTLVITEEQAVEIIDYITENLDRDTRCDLGFAIEQVFAFHGLSVNEAKVE